MFGTELISDLPQRMKRSEEISWLPGKDPQNAPRLDSLLVERGFTESRTRAQALIMAGAVHIGDEVVTKAGSRVAPDAHVWVETPGERAFVSRAGQKLAHALDIFGVKVEGRYCLDAGASTGGFTDVLLQRGAAKVIAVDVGYGQLDWSLRNDPRVLVMERTNVRYLSGRDLAFAPDLLVADLSFISLVVALANLLSTTPAVGEAVVLVKPQFEAGPEHVSRGGLVRDPTVRAATVQGVVEGFKPLGVGAVDITRSPVSGRKAGNVEYPLRLLRGVDATLGEERIFRAVGGNP